MPSTRRLRALDLFRGLTVVGMVLVNSSGSDAVHPFFDHAPWNGLTLADLVFPSFLLMVGVSAALSRAARLARGQTPGGILRDSAVRAAGLFALGLIINVVVFREAGGVRWPGVLQRVALCAAGVSALLYIDLPGLEPPVAALLLIGYWLALTRVPVPGHGAGVLTPEGSLPTWLDRRLMAGHLETALQDPEGLLSTIPAFATSLLGLIAGRRLATHGALEARRLFAAGLALAAGGAWWSRTLPLNKHLWTSSFALVAGGLCLAGLAATLALYEEAPPRGAKTLEALGRHALAAYVAAGFVYGVLEFLPARLPGGAAGNAKLLLNARLFETWLAPRDASLAFALAFTALIAVAARGLD